jgi:hypothetical protein
VHFGGSLSAKVTEDQSLIRNDPASEACIPLLAEVIAEELRARLAIGDPTRTAEDITQLAELVADHVLGAFEVKQRPADKPRNSWRSPNELA